MTDKEFYQRVFMALVEGGASAVIADSEATWAVQRSDAVGFNGRVPLQNDYEVTAEAPYGMYQGKPYDPVATFRENRDW